ncbi:MAG: exopolysaccharide biosynthesis protein [Rubrivivax sp.]|jgi:hypothetical protein
MRTDTPPPAEHLHERLQAAANRLAEPDGEPLVRLDDIAQAHGAAAQGTLLVLMALPCMLPIPGVGTVLGSGLLLMALLLWRPQVPLSLPARVARFELSNSTAQRVLRHLARIYQLASRHARERWVPLATHPLHRLWQVPKVMLMAGIIILPLPLGNVLPAIAVALLGLGLAFRDGLAVLMSTVFAALSVTYVSALGLGLVQVGSWLG